MNFLAFAYTSEDKNLFLLPVIANQNDSVLLYKISVVNLFYVGRPAIFACNTCRAASRL